MSATLVAILAFLFLLFAALASAISYRFISVAPVRGGTYFSLQRQRKVGKRKPLQTSSACEDSASACRS
ncbi:hypothetical protein PSAB6_520002 [Paraburkholderia sabiae]|nr:hypothetical protein PSAB6_520002 [Paraburkholderia sabiae]